MDRLKPSFGRPYGASARVENTGALTQRFPVIGILCHYYLGQLYERTGKHDQAINEYQEFLSHFPSSQSRLPRLAKLGPHSSD